MSRRRYVSNEISVDRDVAQLSDFEALLYTWMVPHAEDDGTMTADPNEISWTVVPSRRRTSAEITEAIDHMGELGLVIPHEGRLYFPRESFYKYQTYIPPAKRRVYDPTAEKRRETPEKTASPSPSPTPIPSPTKHIPDFSDEFAVFYSLYPRKAEPKEARKAWDKAMKDTPPSKIIDGLKRLLPTIEAQEKRYIKYPATWLNAGCWEDESPPEEDALLELTLERNRHPRAVR